MGRFVLGVVVWWWLVVECMLESGGVEGWSAPSSVASLLVGTSKRSHMRLYSSSGSDSDSSELNHDEIARYSRHLVLSDVGMKGQKRLKESSVLVIGAGGLGSPCLLYLAAAGVGHIGIVDADVVDDSNLQRQIIHGTSTVGMSKCESARTRIKDINPFVQVRTYEEEFTSTSALRILQEGFSSSSSSSSDSWDVVIDGSDNFPTKYLINDACQIVNVPWVYSAILAFEGQVSVFNYKGGPTYRDLLPTPPPPGDVPSCAEGGVLGVLPGTMGCIQATEALKIILGEQHSQGLLVGRMLVYDAMAMRFSEVGLKKTIDAPPITQLIDYQGFCAGPKSPTTTTTTTTTTTKQTTNVPSTNGRTMDETEETQMDSDQQPSFHNISPKDTLQKLADGWTPWVLDVRLQTENDIVSLPFTDLVVPHREVLPSHIPDHGDVIVSCKMGGRAKKAINLLIDAGVDPNRLWNLDGGIMQWQKDIDPNMPRY